MVDHWGVKGGLKIVCRCRQGPKDLIDLAGHQAQLKDKEIRGSSRRGKAVIVAARGPTGAVGVNESEANCVRNPARTISVSSRPLVFLLKGREPVDRGKKKSQTHYKKEIEPKSRIKERDKIPGGNPP